MMDGDIEYNFTLSKIGDTYYDSNPDIHPFVDIFYKQMETE